MITTLTTTHAAPRLAPTHCLRCEKRIQERWHPTDAICANCALERELFEREGRSA